MIILGIDPGFAITGYGIIDYRKNRLKVKECGFITTSSKEKFNLRLEKLYKELKKIIRKYKPNRVAIEDLYFAKNTKTAVKVGQAMGVIFLATTQLKRPIEIYTPLQVKQAVSGYGRASKQQVQKMVKVLLRLKEIPKPDDVADALAVAICCAHNKSLNKIDG